MLNHAEDIHQVHHEELQTVIDVLKSGVVTGISGHHTIFIMKPYVIPWVLCGVFLGLMALLKECLVKPLVSLLLTTLDTFPEVECRDDSHLMFTSNCSNMYCAS
ncbi:Beige/BEACH domain [Raphanus sativus]|nr:Beige/BEACH domain [Raphanus sativus]